MGVAVGLCVGIGFAVGIPIEVGVGVVTLVASSRSCTIATIAGVRVEMAIGDLAFSTDVPVGSALIVEPGVDVGTGASCGTLVGVGAVAGVVQATDMMP